MAVYNLGSFGARRPSVLSPVSKALKETGDTLLKTYALKSQLADLEVKKRKDNIEYGEKMMEDLAFYKESKDPQEWEAFKQGDQFKQMYKVIQDIFPERVDKDKKDIFLPTSKDIYAKKMDKMIYETKDKLMKQGEGALTEGEFGILKMEGYKDEAAEALAVLQKNEIFSLLIASPDPVKQKKASAMLINTVKALKERRSGRSNALKPANDKDPFGILP